MNFDIRRRFNVIAEVGQAHDGSLGTAHAYIDAVARAGVQAVKFQTHIAAAESTPSEPWRVRFSLQDASRYDYWRRMEFSEKQWEGLRKHADDVGIAFVSSPFSVEAIHLLERVGVSAWKIASGETGNLPLIERVAAHGAPVLLSTGMSNLEEVDAAAAVLESAGVDWGVMQCTSAYPCPPERLGLNMIPILAERYSAPAGLSDHSGTIFSGLAAVTLGARLLEVHVTFSRESFGPDTPSSLELAELTQLVHGAEFIATALDNPVDKDSIAMELEPLRNLFTKSVVVRHALPAGHELLPQDLIAKKPGTGIPAQHLPSVVGRRVRVALTADHVLSYEDLE